MSYNLNGPDDGRPITWERDAGDDLQAHIEAQAEADEQRERELADTAQDIAEQERTRLLAEADTQAHAYAQQIAGDPADPAYNQRLQNAIAERHPELSAEELSAVADYVHREYSHELDEHEIEQEIQR